MTDDQKQAITRLRLAGWGYDKISSYIDVNENTVKSYCRRNNLAGYGSKFIKERPNAPYGRCKNCGAIVEQTPKRKAKLFCSDECRMKWWGLHRDQIKHKTTRTVTCPTCGKQFIVYGNASRKYCSHECYIADRFGKRGRMIMEEKNIRNPEVNRNPDVSNLTVANSNLPASRNLTVSSGCDANYNPVPFIRLQGKWLRDLGFDIGDKVVVECQDGRLVIRKTKLKMDSK